MESSSDGYVEPTLAGHKIKMVPKFHDKGYVHTVPDRFLLLFKSCSDTV